MITSRLHSHFADSTQHYSGLISKTEGSVRKIQKRAHFHNKNVKKGTPDLPSYIHGFFTVVLIKQIFEKIMKAASGSSTQF